MLFKKFRLVLVMLIGCLCFKKTNAQLWRYIGDTPVKEKAFDKYLKKEAYKVITHHTSDADKFPYDEIIYRLWSLDSSLFYIHISQLPLTKTLTVKCATDSLEIKDCVGPARLHLLRKNLFEIVYSPRGGSDDGYDNVLLLAVRNGKFRIALEVESLHDFDGPGFFGLDEAHLKLVGSDSKNYQLTIKMHQLCRADKKAKNFDHYETYTLMYDNTINLFYSVYRSVSGYIYNDAENRRQVSGTYPVIKLGEAKYCYIDNCWYAMGRDSESGKITLWNYCHRSDGKNKI